MAKMKQQMDADVNLTREAEPAQENHLTAHGRVRRQTAQRLNV